MSRFTLRTRFTVSSALFVWMLVMAGYFLPGGVTYASPVSPQSHHFFSTRVQSRHKIAGLAQEQYDDRAYPKTIINYQQSIGVYNAFQTVSRRAFGRHQSWQLIGPTTTKVPAPVTAPDRPTVISGRETALAVSNPCTEAACRIWVGAAGGGIWTTDNGLSPTPDWHPSNSGIASNAIGAIALDPNDATGATLYVGTGEPNGSSDSEAGIGLYKSTNFGQTWQLIMGSVPAAKDRSIGAIAIDPTNAKHIYIGTDVARHGVSSVTGGRFTPSDAPVVGLYESRDGGKTFKLVFSKESDVVDPGSPSGNDFFRGGVTGIQFNTTGLLAGQPPQIYFSMFDYGLFRSNNGSFEQVFASAGGGDIANSSSARTQFALAPMGNKLRIYVTDSGSAAADFYRVDDATVPASTLTDGVHNPGWLKLSNPTPGTPGFASYNFCTGQCWYDMWVASPPGHPDTVWIGGSFQYGEVVPPNPSNGRAVQRSTDAGVDFTDMTGDAQSPAEGMHPDQHAIAFASSNPDIAFLGSDGGLVRTSGSFADISADCNSRGLSGANLADCKHWLSAVPTHIYVLNAGLATLQFQSLTVNPQSPGNDVIGGTQDNGTLAYTGSTTWFESVGGDGGQSSINVDNPNSRMHMYFGTTGDVNFHGDDPTGWDYMTGPLDASTEQAAFYVPLIGDPKVGGTDFVGLEHIWRTQDNAGSQAFLDQTCNEFTGHLLPTCGDWVPVGANLVNTTFGADKLGSYVVAIKRAQGDAKTMWVGTRRGRLFISTNADAAASSVTFTRIDTSAQPTRFISGIEVDPANPFHAFISFSGYNAYTPTTPGHVFDVLYNPSTGKATWTDISYDLGDQPITGIAFDSQTGNLYASTDFGVVLLRSHTTDWDPAAPGLPPVAVYGLTISLTGRVLYSATHGRGAYRLTL